MTDQERLIGYPTNNKPIQKEIKQFKEGPKRERPKPFRHDHSKWEPCGFDCPIWYFFFDRLEAWYLDSEKKNIVIHGVKFVQH